MKRWLVLLGTFLCFGVLAFSQTADELVNKNITARGGLDKIKAIQTLRVSGTAMTPYGVPAAVMTENMRPDMVRETFSIVGMTAVQAYDGTTGWQIQPFGGKKDPQLMGEDDLRDLQLDSDIEGALVDYKAKGNTVEFMGHDVVDGDDALRLKVTLKTGDILYYYLDPDTYLEVRKDVQEFIRGSVNERRYDLGSYKPVNGVMFPYSITSGPKNDPESATTVSVEKVEVNIPIEKSDFAVPASLKR
jgi:hypothetical protein